MCSSDLSPFGSVLTMGLVKTPALAGWGSRSLLRDEDVSEGHDVGVGHDLDLGVGDAVLPLDEERVGDHADDQGEEVGADDDHDGDDGHGWFLSGSWSHYGACEF